jgi:hypothetical protein
VRSGPQREGRPELSHAPDPSPEQLERLGPGAASLFGSRTARPGDPGPREKPETARAAEPRREKLAHAIIDHEPPRILRHVIRPDARLAVQTSRPGGR